MNLRKGVGKCLKKQLILSFHLGTETQVYLLGHSQRHVLAVAQKQMEEQTFWNGSFALRSLTIIFQAPFEVGLN